MALWISGIGIVRGIGIGRVQRLYGGDPEVPEYQLTEADTDREVERFLNAQQKAREQLSEAAQQIPDDAAPEIAALIDAHLLMLNDLSLTEAVVNQIRLQLCNAEIALKRQREILVSVFEQMEDPYLRTRRDDVIQVVGRILRILLNSDKHLSSRNDGKRPAIIVADDVAVADIILFSQQGIAGFLTEYGGPLSHSAILARSLGIPAVVGVRGARRLLREGETVVVDGERGSVMASPDKSALAYFRKRQKQKTEFRKLLTGLRKTPSVSRDGTRIRLLANIELPDDAAEAVQLGAEGIGLYRTEFLFMNRQDAPDEEEQFAAYTHVASSVKGPIVIRTADLGTDKHVNLGFTDSPPPTNPALGLRAIRLCLKDQMLFRTQIRALLRASAYGDIRIMLPMISSVSEFRQALDLIHKAREDLRMERVAVAERVCVGAMIETPAAALIAGWLTQYAQFFSIGTNDLIQYTLAIDRVDDKVNYLYDPLHPAVLTLINLAIEAGLGGGLPVSLCGEMAGDPRYTRLLLGLGLTEFSMHPDCIPEIKRIVIDSNVSLLKREVASLFKSATFSELRERLDRLA